MNKEKIIDNLIKLKNKLPKTWLIEKSAILEAVDIVTNGKC